MITEVWGADCKGHIAEVMAAMEKLRVPFTLSFGYQLGGLVPYWGYHLKMVPDEKAEENDEGS